MKISFLLLAFVCTAAYTQETVKLFLDKNYIMIDSSEASIQREAVLGNEYYKIVDRDMKGRLLNSIEYKSLDPRIEHGHAIHCIIPDSIYCTGEYEDGNLSGKWIYYDNIKPDTVNYPEAGQLAELFDCPSNSINYKMKKGLWPKGQFCIDSLSVFFKSNFHIPARLKGSADKYDINFNFIIDNSGNVKCPEFLNYADKDIKAEVYRILSLFKYKIEYNKPVHLQVNLKYFDQNPVPASDINNNAEDYNREDFGGEEEYFIVEVMPLFNGGEPAIEFKKYIAQNLRYPDDAAEKGITGKVIVQFAVNSKGEVVDEKIIAGSHPSLNAEAIRVVKSSPLWTPGFQRGEPVKVLFTFPINFVLQGKPKQQRSEGHISIQSSEK